VEDARVQAGWERLPGTAAGAYYRIEPDLIVALPNPSLRQSAEAAEASLNALDAIARSAGRKQGVLVLIDQVASQDAGARRVWSTPRHQETRCCQGLVSSTLLARAIGSFFLGLNKAAVPTRMFADLESAAAWAREMAELHGGHL
jgi:hypothetical protein